MVNEVNPHPVKFTATIEQAKLLAAQQKQGFFVLFCTPELVRVTGEDQKAWEEFKSNNKGLRPEWTVFDCPDVTKSFKAKDLKIFVKVGQTPENEALFKQYGAKINTLILCAPNGEKLVSTSGISKEAALHLLESYKKTIDDWYQLQTAVPSQSTPKPPTVVK